jgi:hypothetical protein
VGGLTIENGTKGFGGIGMKSRMFAAFLLGVLFLSLAGLVEGGDNKELMLIFTTDSNAELNPCG